MVSLIGAGEEDTNLLVNENNKSWIKCEEISKRGGETEYKYTVLPMELSKHIKENLRYIFVRGAAVEMPLMYVYTNGYYKLVSDNEEFYEEFKNYLNIRNHDIDWYHSADIVWALPTSMPASRMQPSLFPNGKTLWIMS